MTNFTIRTVRFAHQTSDVKCFDARDSLFVELLILGNPKFKQTIRGRKFLFGNGKNAFDDCIVYLGRLNQGKWITDEDYQVAISVAYRAWEKFNASETHDVVSEVPVSPLDRNQGVELGASGDCVAKGLEGQSVSETQVNSPVSPWSDSISIETIKELMGDSPWESVSEIVQRVRDMNGWTDDLADLKARIVIRSAVNAKRMG